MQMIFPSQSIIRKWYHHQPLHLWCRVRTQKWVPKSWSCRPSAAPFIIWPTWQLTLMLGCDFHFCKQDMSSTSCIMSASMRVYFGWWEDMSSTGLLYYVCLHGGLLRVVRGYVLHLLYYVRLHGGLLRVVRGQFIHSQVLNPFHLNMNFDYSY